MKRYLSKSALMSARQCLKRLHLEIHRPELRVISPAVQAALTTGRRVGQVARRIYGTDDTVLIPYEAGLRHALGKSARLVEAGPEFPLFEATFRYDDVLIRADVLKPDGHGWRIVEVKASTVVKEEHAFDCTVQSWVFQRAGHALRGIALAYVDSSFVYRGDGDYQGLLIEKDMAHQVGQLMPIVPEWIRRAREAASGQEPDVPVGQHCFNPYECPFVSYCWPSDCDYPVQGLSGSRAKLAEFVLAGYRDVRDVPPARLTEKQRRIRRVTASGKPELLPDAARFVAELGYPRHYLDFEAVAPAVPIWQGTRPYQTLPFQWSCHYETASGEIDHAEFLDLSGEPPMRRLAESLIRALGSEGPVLTYTAYEQRILFGLIERCPDLEAPLTAIVARLVDLAPVTRRSYYHPEMRGSWSLKDVLPTITDDLPYVELEGIHEGTEASEGYLEAIDPATPTPRKAELDKQLRRYCKRDTEGMVRLVRFLAGA